MTMNPKNDNAVATFDELISLLKERYLKYPKKLARAARAAIEKPEDIAFLTMRKLAEKENLTPTVFTRLAKSLGFDSYNDFKKIFVDSIRSNRDDFGYKAQIISRSSESSEPHELMFELIEQENFNISAIVDVANIEKIIEASKVLSSAEKIYWVGYRSCYPAMYLANYFSTYIGKNSILLDHAGGTSIDLLRFIKTSDVIFVHSVVPYTTQIIEIAEYCKNKNLKLIVLTDKLVSPLAVFADLVIQIKNETSGFIHSTVAAQTVVQILISLCIRQLGETVVNDTEKTERLIRSFNAYTD